MVKRYPHTATLRWFTEPTKNDADGVETEGQLVEHPDLKCRFESAGNSVYRSSGGDTALVYGYKVFLPVLDFEIPVTATIIKGVSEMSITRIDTNQKNTVLWL